MAQSKKILKNRMQVIICNHCHKKIIHPALVDLMLVCPHCKKSVNGQYYHDLTRAKETPDDQEGS